MEELRGDKVSLTFLIVGMIAFMTFMWRILRSMVGGGWYSWIDPVVIALLSIMCISGFLTILTSRPASKEE